GSHSGSGSRVFDVILSAPTRRITGTYAVDGGVAVPFVLVPGTSQRIPLLAGAALATGFNTAQNRGVFIVADQQDLTVDHRETFDSEQYSETIQRHTIALGQRFRLAGYSLNREGVTQANRDIAVIYAPTGATVTLTAPPGVATRPFWDETPADTDGVLTLAIPAGQSMAVRTNGGFDFDGALLTSTAPVGVVGGGRGWFTGEGCGDDGMDSILPTNVWGQEWVVRLPTGTSLGTPAQSYVRVIADTNNTEVFLDASMTPVATLNAGQFYTFQPSTAVARIRTSQPAMVWMNAGRNGCELDTVFLPPVSFVASVAGLGVDFNVLGGGELSMLLPAAALASVRLDGAVPTFSTTETPAGRTDLRYVRFVVTAGNHSVTAASDFQLMLASRTSPSGLLAYFNPFRIPGCGDANVDAPETCDDGNADDGDGCSASCRVEPGYNCGMAEPSVCVATCGDGTVAAGIETCDDNNVMPGDGCSATCRIEVSITTPTDGTLTADSTPTLTGQADPGATVVVSVGGTMLGSATADLTGRCGSPHQLGDRRRLPYVHGRRHGRARQDLRATR
ncbi:MAG: DUF4215 domain-containing protein, partial [Polyangiales bacterium]